MMYSACMSTEGTFIDERTVRLRTGQTIRQVADYAGSAGLDTFRTGWLSGVLYVSHDSGLTWSASDISFRAA